MILRKFNFLITIFLLAILFTLPFYASGYFISLFITIFLFAILAESWNILSGYTGYVSLGTAAFFGIGICVCVLFWKAKIAYPLIILSGGLASAIFALFVGLPCLRIKGPYFVILTFGLSEAVRFTIEQITVKIGSMENILVGAPSTETFYYSLLIIGLLIIVIDCIIRKSKFGLGLASIKQNEDASEVIGVKTTKYKLMALVISAFFMGLPGPIMALRWTYITPSIAFSPLLSFQAMIMAILGGSKDFRGPLLGAVILTLISEAFGINFPYHYMILLGVTLIILVKFLPGGLVEPIDEMQRKVLRVWSGKYGNPGLGGVRKVQDNLTEK